MRICPHCAKALVALEYRKVEVDWCPACRGLWLDEGELGLLLRGDPAAHPRLNFTPGARTTRKCPSCGDRMREARAERAGVTVDQCVRGHGLWFDAGEVRAIINAVCEPGEMAALSDFYESLFGASSTQGDKS